MDGTANPHQPPVQGTSAHVGNKTTAILTSKTRCVCEICHDQFLRPNDLAHHIYAVHCELRHIYKCKESYCNSYHTGYLYHRIHTTKHDIVKGCTQCQLCRKQFDTKEKAMEHLADHLHKKKERNCQCGICNETFTQHCSLRRHVHHFHQNLTCHICKYCETGFGYDEYVRHNARCLFKSVAIKLLPASTSQQLTDVTAIDDSIESLLFVCTTCWKPFRQEHDLVFHYVMNHSPDLKKYRCLLCSKVYMSYLNYRYHMALHVAECRECMICGEIYPTRKQLVAHAKKHKKRLDVFIGDIEEQTCPICQKVMPQMKRHVKSHFNSALKPCIRCGKMYQRSFFLDRHVKICKGLVKQQKKKKHDGTAEQSTSATGASAPTADPQTSMCYNESANSLMCELASNMTAETSFSNNVAHDVQLSAGVLNGDILNADTLIADGSLYLSTWNALCSVGEEVGADESQPVFHIQGDTFGLDDLARFEREVEALERELVAEPVYIEEGIFH